MTISISPDELTGRCVDALVGAGAEPDVARTLAEATVEAELVGNRAVGVAHLADYLDGYRQGRISLGREPQIRRAAAAVVTADARGGLAQTAFAAALAELLTATREAGVAALWISSSFTCGELGWYPRRVAAEGRLALAGANSPALMSLGGAPHPVLGTNPLAFAVPRPGKLPLVVDQASSATAFVNVRRAAEAGDRIPPGWALDASGEATESAEAALSGTLLPFGGHRGGNVALLIEILATLAGGAFSLDAAPFQHGSRSPGIGVFVLALDPDRFPGAMPRLTAYFERLQTEHGVRLPALDLTKLPDVVEVSQDALDRLR